MTSYLVAARYNDHETDLCGDSVECDEGPFMAVVKHCMLCCKVKRHEAVRILAEGAWEVVMWVVEEGGPRKLRYPEIGYPWAKISLMQIELQEIDEALGKAEALEFLLGLPGMAAGNHVNLQPAREYRDTRGKELIALQQRWHAMQQPDPADGDREARVVQVDSPNE